MQQYNWLSDNLPDPLANPEVKNLRRQHQLILSAIGEGVYGVDLPGNATFVNLAAAQMIGWDAEELIGQSMHKVLHHSKPDRTPYPEEECPIYAAFHDGEGFHTVVLALQSIAPPASPTSALSDC